MVLRPEQFTEQAREVLNNSQELVRRFNHSQWDVEHILLALLELEEGLPGDILNELEIRLGGVENLWAAHGPVARDYGLRTEGSEPLDGLQRPCHRPHDNKRCPFIENQIARKQKL